MHFSDRFAGYLYIVLAIEITILILVLFSITFGRIWRYFKDHYDRNQKKKLSKIITDWLLGKTDYQSNVNLLKIFSKKNLLLQIENFNSLYKGEEWDSLKRKITEQYFLPIARKWYGHRSWKKRNYAARCFALSPLKEDKNKIFSLAEDSEFLVSSIGAIAAIQLNDKQAVSIVLNNMSKSWGYARAYFRDVFLEPDNIRIFDWIEEIAASTEDVSIHLACLEALSGKSITISYPFLKRDLESPNPLIRLAAVKIYAHNPQENSAGILLKCLDDPDENIRVQAAFGLQFHESKECLEKLEQTLSDTSWPVRLEAATTLEKFGQTGWEILRRQVPEKNINAYEVAKYVLRFDW